MPDVGALTNLYYYQSIIWHAGVSRALIRNPGDCQFGRHDGRRPVIKPQSRAFASRHFGKNGQQRKIVLEFH